MAYIGTYLLLSVALFLLFLVTGSIADPLSRGLAPTGVERYLLRLTSGLAAWVAALFLIAATGRLGPIAVSLLASAAVTAALALWLRRRGAPGPRREPALPVDVVTRLGMAALAVIATALLLQTLRPIVAWDADVYHLTVPRIWLERGGFARIPFNVYSNWPSNVQLLFGLAMIVRDYVLAKTIHFGLGIALLVGLGWWVGRRSSAAWGIVAAAALLTLPVFLYEIRVAYVDIALALFLFLAFVFCERALSADAAQERRWLLFSGVACGLATGTKVNGVAGALAVAGVFVGSSLLSGRRPGDLLRPLGALAAPIAAFAAMWTAKSAWLTGNPIYPLLHRWLGGPEWSADLATAHAAWNRSLGMGRDALDYLLLLPRVLFLGGEGYDRFDGRLHPILAVLLGLAVTALGRRREVRLLLSLAALWFGAWALTSQQMRFLIPALPLVVAAGTLAAHDWSGRLRARPGIVERGAVVVTVALAVAANGDYLRQARTLVEIFGRGAEAVQQGATSPVYRFINEELPEDSRILFVNLNRGFFCHRSFIADSFFEASQIAHWLSQLGDRDALHEGLAAAGVTHVLVKREQQGPVFPDAFVDLIEEADRVLYDAEDASGSYFLVELPTTTEGTVPRSPVGG